MVASRQLLLLLLLKNKTENSEHTRQKEVNSTGW
jgi:hypothetical protein